MPAEHNRTRIKICGLLSPHDVELAVEAGVDAVGMILAPSPRQVSLNTARAIARAVPPFVDLYAVVVDPKPQEVAELRGLGAGLQFHGDEFPSECEGATSGGYLKAYHVPAGGCVELADFDYFAEQYPRATILVDSVSGNRLGGTGLPFAWESLRNVARRRRIVVSGGLTPENVGLCIRTARPFAVDVRSGVETDGRKDARKLGAFVAAVREADARA